jgi:Lrp/AsnC family transcriptional regulator
MQNSHRPQILRLLQHNADLSAPRIAERWNCHSRRAGGGFTTWEEGIIERKGRPAQSWRSWASVSLCLSTSSSRPMAVATLEEFEQAVVGYPEVLGASWPAAPDGYLLKVVAKGHRQYRRFLLDHLPQLRCTAHSHITMSEVKRTTELPLVGALAS